MGPEKRLLLSGLAMNASNLALREEGSSAEFLLLAALSLSGGEVDTARKQATIRDASVEKGTIKAIRSGVGRINLLDLAQRQGEPPKGEARPRLGEPTPAEGWIVKVSRARAKGCALELEDRSVHGPARLALTNISIDAHDLSTEKNTKGTVSLSSDFGDRGRLSFQIGLVISPLSLKGRAAVKDVALAPFQPYMPGRVTLAIERGTVSARGEVSVTRAGAGHTGLSYAGSLSMANVASADSVAGTTFLGWQSLATDAVSAGYNPLFLHSDKVSLTGLYLRLGIGQDGVFNVQHLVKAAQTGPDRTGGATGPPKAGKLASQIDVGTVVLENGVIDFSDQFIKPPYSARLTEISGSVSGISTTAKKPAQVEVKGQINGYAPARVSGRLDLFRPEAYVDVTASLTGVDLTSMSPFSAHYVGYAIQRGTLTLNAKYLLQNRKLEANNSAGLTQFDLGKQAESRPVIQLPVKLAISLLKDREGNINLDIPVSGNLSNPHFSFTEAIVGAIKNVLEKIVTSPLSFLGSLFAGGGKDLGYLQFDYGSDQVLPSAKEKIDALHKALQERPALKLRASGYVDVRADPAPLKDKRFLDLLKVQKIKDLRAKGAPSLPLDRIAISPGEYNIYLEKAYRAAKFTKPKNILGFNKSLTPAEMETLLKGHISVTDQDLISLALQRAVHVRASLLASGGVEPDRVVVAESNPLHPEEKKDVRESRVEMAVQ